MPVLETKRTVLRPFALADAEDVFAYCKDPRVGPVAGWKPHESLEESREIIRTVFSAPDVFAVTDKDTGRVVGSAGFTAPHREEVCQGSTAEIGYALSPDYWGRGLMAEVVADLLRYGFQDAKMDEIWATHYQENHRSKRVIEKNGFLYAFTESLSDAFYPDRPTCFYVWTREAWEKARRDDWTAT